MLPTSFYWRNWPVSIIDSSGASSLTLSLEYPRIVYLHGRHLNYNLRTIYGELNAEQSVDDIEPRGLFAHFRSTLASTGLIVIGYSGAVKDQVIKTIRNASRDANSIPFGLYWALYNNEYDVSDEVHQLIKERTGAYYLVSDSIEPLDAQTLMRSIFEELDADHENCGYDWIESLNTNSKLVRRELDTPETQLLRLTSSTDRILSVGTLDQLRRLSKELELRTTNDFIIKNRISKFRTAVAKLNQAKLSFRLQEFSRSKAQAKIAFGLSKESENYSCQAQSLLILSRIASLHDMYEESLHDIQEAININTTIHDEHELAWCYIEMANYLRTQEKYHQAINNLDQVEELSRSIQDKNISAIANATIGAINTILGDFISAEQRLLNSLLVFND